MRGKVAKELRRHAREQQAKNPKGGSSFRIYKTLKTLFKRGTIKLIK